MITAAIILAIFIFIALLRIGVSAEYSADGVVVDVRVGFIKLRIMPKRGKVEEEKKKKKEKKEKKEKKPGKLKDYLDMLPAVKKALGRLRRRLLIKNLTIYYIAGGEDFAKTAMSFGAASVAFGTVIAFFENCFRLKKRDLRASADFYAREPYIYVYAAISLAVWEAVYVAFGLLLVFGNIAIHRTRTSKNANSGKD